MFTGIVEEIGSVKNVIKSAKTCVLTINASKILEDVSLGDSIAVNGVCLTVTKFDKGEFSVDVMNETLKKSSLNSIKSGTRVNLERAMSANGRFGGHIVSGHIDGLGKIISIREDGNAIWFEIEAEKEILKYIIKKGSVALDGVSLTVAELGKRSFKISMIPHTLAETIFSDKVVGDVINIENDCIGKYVERLLEKDSKGIDINFLREHGF